jgi:hypothetical protein
MVVMFIRNGGRSWFLFEQQSDNGGAGGGGAPPVALTAAEIANIANQAVTAQLKRELPKAFETLLPTFTKAIDDKFAALKPTEPSGEKPAGTPQQTPEFAALQRQLAEMKTTLESSEKARIEVERRAREDAAFGELKTALGGHIKPEFIDPIAKSLYYADKRVEFDETGKPLFRAMVPQYTGGPLQETLLPLRDGVEAFAKSKEADAYRPAPTPKTPNSPPPRLPRTPGALPGNQPGKIPTASDDPTWASRMAAELEAQGVPTGSFD